MQLSLLHLDDALQRQESFLATCRQQRAHEIELKTLGAEIRLWAKDALLERLKRQLDAPPAQGEPVLTFLGSGDFHHVSALLIERSLDQMGEPVTVLHFDNHPDWVGFGGGMHCGSWINRALAHPAVARLVTVGLASGDLRLPELKGAQLHHLKTGRLEVYPYWRKASRVGKSYGSSAGHRQKGGKLYWTTIEALGESGFLAHLLSRIETKAVYITLDKDVLASSEAVTNWDQGHLRLSTLLRWIAAIGKAHRIIGADVTGDYSLPRYAGTPWTRTRKRAEIWIDQPRHAPRLGRAASLNAAANHALLGAFREVMA